MRRPKNPKQLHNEAAQIDGRDESKRTREGALRWLHTSYLLFWKVCPEKSCQRARACRGDVDLCHERWWPRVPEEYKIQLRATIKARVRGLSPRQAALAGEAEVAKFHELEQRLDKTIGKLKSEPVDSATTAEKNARPERERAKARVRSL